MNDLSKLFLIKNRDYLKVVVSRLFKREDLIRLSRGCYALNDDFDRMELANKLKVPSYVSLETVLQKEGVIFQDYGKTIFSVSNNSWVKKVGDSTFVYAKISDRILANPLGVERVGEAIMATAERALCDRIYLSPGYHFDKVDQLRPQLLNDLAEIYNRRTKKEILQIINQLKK